MDITLEGSLNDFMASQGLARDAAVNVYLEPYAPWLNDPRITEIAVNSEKQVWVYTNEWQCYDLADATEKNLLLMGVAIATYANCVWDDTSPILSASMPDGSRIQMVRAPAVESGRVSFTMRRPSLQTYRLDDFEQQGMFAKTTASSYSLKPHEIMLTELLEQRNYKEFIKQSVIHRQNIVCCGATGSGKTTFMKGIVYEIPINERIITIEDVRELFLPHPNAVHLLYPNTRNRFGNEVVTTQDLLKSCLRMKPDRILLAELRSQECLYYIRSAASGHPGSITSCHAGSPSEAFEQMAIMIKESDAGANLEYSIIRRLLDLTVDVVIQFDSNSTGRYIREIYYDPKRKYEI